MKTFDPSKPVQTRGGRKARIVCADVKGDKPIIAVLTKDDGAEYAERFRADGAMHNRPWPVEGPTDLVNVPEKHVRWVNAYASGSASVGYRTREDADLYAGRQRIACIRIEFEEGEGLESGK